MTRGTIAFLDYEKETNKWFLYSSAEFNGDMGPDMSAGKILLKYFDDFYFDPANHNSKKQKMQQIVISMLKDFGYYEDSNHVEFLDMFSKYELPSNVLDLHEVRVSSNTHSIDYRNDPWSKYFHYSDWGYLINLSDSKFQVKTIDNEEKDIEIIIPKNIVTMFRFRALQFFYSPKMSRKLLDFKAFQKQQEK